MLKRIAMQLAKDIRVPPTAGNLRNWQSRLNPFFPTLLDDSVFDSRGNRGPLSHTKTMPIKVMTKYMYVELKSDTSRKKYPCATHGRKPPKLAITIESLFPNPFG
jgi:hypothetical protein